MAPWLPVEGLLGLRFNVRPRPGRPCARRRKFEREEGAFVTLSILGRVFLASGGLSAATAIYYLAGFLSVREVRGPGDSASAWREMHLARVRVWGTCAVGSFLFGSLMLLAARLI